MRLQFSPGGRVLAFNYSGGPAELGNPPDIWIKSVSRRAQPRRMIPKPPGTDFHKTPTSEQLDREPDWSPDGKSIVFSRWTVGRGPTRSRSEIRTTIAGTVGYWSTMDMTRRGRCVTRLPSSAGLGASPSSTRFDLTGQDCDRVAVGVEPDWSPDGRRLAFTFGEGAPSGTQLNGPAHIATISRTGDRLRRITQDDRVNDSVPTFSPGGGQLTFVRSGSSATRLAVVRTDGRHLRRLAQVESPYIDWQPLRRRR